MFNISFQSIVRTPIKRYQVFGTEFVKLALVLTDLFFGCKESRFLSEMFKLGVSHSNLVNEVWGVFVNENAGCAHYDRYMIVAFVLFKMLQLTVT